MLFGQDLRGCHKRSLETGFDGEEHRGNCHNRLAGTDVSLEQTVHWLSLRQIAAHFLDHPCLSTREIEWQATQEFFQQLA